MTNQASVTKGNASAMPPDSVRRGLERLQAGINRAVLGCGEEAELLLVALLAGGHALIEGLPGMGKTSLAKVMARSLDCCFKRIQFTPDLLPVDILGYSIFDQQAGEFRFHPGPVFCNVLLADEINRTTPRIQSALLEAMNEGQVTTDGRTRRLEPPFFVMATQNHRFATGTFPLPESQLDRFLLSLEMVRPPQEIQAKILRLHHAGDPCDAIQPVLSREDLLAAQEQVRRVAIADPMTAYLAALVEATHGHEEFITGVSVRGGLALMRAAQAAAFLAGRDAVYPDDIKRLFPHVVGHRLAWRNRSRKTDGNVRLVLRKILADVPVP